VLKSLPDGCVDAVVTDPPYGVQYQHHATKREGRCTSAWPKLRGDSRAAAAAAAAEIKRLLAPDAYALVFYGWRQAGAVQAAFEAVKMRQVSNVVWHKGTWMGLGWHSRGTHECVMVFAKGRPRPASRSFRDVQTHQPEHGLHATQKPVALLVSLLNQYCPAGGTVLDPFMGSGTTGVACVETGRDFIGVELDKGYFAVAKKRIAGAVPC
jgi:DNA modification methylase